jgi:hypothetical protein
MQDCDHMDSLPFDAHYDSAEEEPAPFFDEEDEDGEDEDGPLLTGVL